jgi:hypothetical protein
MDGGALVGVGKLNGSGIAQMKTLTLPAGKHSLRAVYGGSGTSLPSQSATQNYVVTALTATCCLPAPKTYSDGGGTFSLRSIAIGDLNGDQKADLAVLDQFGVRALLGNGDGTFHVGAASYSARDHANDLPLSFAMGDFNGDGNADFVVGTSGPTIVVLMGNGDGSFQALTEYAVGIQPPPFPGSGIGVVAVGDFNQDGKADVVAADLRDATVYILLGNGDGSFQPAISYAVGNSPQSVVIADFNADGIPDLAVANRTSNNVSVLRGIGDGTFAPAVSYAVGSAPTFLISGDFNGDGNADIVVANGANVTVLAGNGDGTFQPGVNSVLTATPGFLANADYDGDGKQDLVLANPLRIALGNGDSTFQPPIRPIFPGVTLDPGAIAIGDFNGDGRSDIAAANTSAATVTILIGEKPFDPNELRFPIPLVSNGQVDVPYVPVQFTAFGGTGIYTWSATGLPSGLSMSPSGVLSGTPTPGSQGTYNATVTVTDSNHTSVSGQTGTFRIGDPVPPGIISVFPNPVPGADANQQITINGTGFKSGTGLKVHLTKGGSAFDLTGSQVTFISSTQLTITFNVGTMNAIGTVQVVNPDGGSSNIASFSVTAPPSVPVTVSLLSPVVLTPGNVGVPYGPVQFTATGGTGGYIWSATGLPSGLAISSGGTLSGSPEPGSQGNYIPSFFVNDSGGHGTVADLPLLIQPAFSAVLTVASVYPSPVPASNANQTILINGSGFQSGTGSKVRLTAVSGSQTDLTGTAVTWVSSNQLSISFNVGTALGTWTVQVFNPDGTSSNILSFSVAAPPVVTSFALPQLAFGGGWYTALYFSNPTASHVSAVVNFIGNDGSPLDVPLAGIGSVSSQTVNLDPGATVILEAPNTGNLVQGWAEAMLPQGAVGYAVFRQSVPGRADQEAVVPLTPESSQRADLIYDDTALTTSVAFLNPSNQQATVTITAHGADGNQIGTSQVTLGARSKRAMILKSLSGLSDVAGKRGWATFSVSSGAVSVMGFRSGTEAFTTIPVAHGTTASATSALPQLAFGGGWYTALYFANTTGSPLSTTVNFVGNDGAPLSVPIAGIGSVSSQTFSLNPGATMILEAPNTGDLVQGWAEASLPQGVVGYGVFRQSVAGRADQEAVVPLTPESSQTADLIYDDTLLTTSVAFLNPSNQPTNVSIAVYGQDGGLIGTALVPLGARAKQAMLLKALPGLFSVVGTRGRVLLSVPSGDVSVLGLRSGTEAFTSIPVNQR